MNHIAVAGNIGAGKTSLADKFSKHFGWEPQYEDIEKNPYLRDFYEDMQRWAFNLQIYFLRSRFNQVIDIKKSEHTIIQDRTIYEDAYIFASNLRDMKLINRRDYETYLSLFNLMCNLVKPPDLIIYLRASVPTLVERIQKRGRNYEANISLDYLKRLNERYEAWAETYDLGKILTINVDNCDFIERPEDMSYVIDIVNAELHGLFQFPEKE
jgi:deoxyadenosine/deoxycytidine kinase